MIEELYHAKKLSQVLLQKQQGILVFKALYLLEPDRAWLLTRRQAVSLRTGVPF
jgi:hypothetical protein